MNDYTLLQDGDLASVTVFNPQGRSPFLITCEHAGREIPSRLGDLGLNEEDLSRHIAWDIGAAVTARQIAERIDAPLVLQRYSRLVIDCNRPVDTSESIPQQSDGTIIPGNKKLSKLEREARHREIHRPFHDTIEEILDNRMHDEQPSALIAFHTFTPALLSESAARPWDMGLLYNRDNRLARAFDQALDELAHEHKIAHNEPYTVCDETDYTLPIHGEIRNIHNLLLEVRNDHVSDENGCLRWGDLLSGVLSDVECNL